MKALLLERPDKIDVQIRRGKDTIHLVGVGADIDASRVTFDLTPSVQALLEGNNINYEILGS